MYEEQKRSFGPSGPKETMADDSFHVFFPFTCTVVFHLSPREGRHVRVCTNIFDFENLTNLTYIENSLRI